MRGALNLLAVRFVLFTGVLGLPKSDNEKEYPRFGPLESEKSFRCLTTAGF